MLALRQIPSEANASWLDGQSLLLLGALAFVLAVWLLIRILRGRGKKESQRSAVLDTETTQVHSVPPAPLPKVEKVLFRLEGEYPEFCSIVRDVLNHAPAESLFAKAEIRRGFSHLEMLIDKAERAPIKGTLGIQIDTRPLSADARREVKATMLTLIRLMENVEGVRQNCAQSIDDNLDRLLDRI